MKHDSIRSYKENGSIFRRNLHDINHFMKVYAYAKTIAEGENLNPELQKLVEVTAVVHDIACPL